MTEDVIKVIVALIGSGAVAAGVKWFLAQRQSTGQMSLNALEIQDKVIENLYKEVERLGALIRELELENLKCHGRLALVEMKVQDYERSPNNRTRITDREEQCEE